MGTKLADIAQLVVQLICNQEVGGSSPSVGTINMICNFCKTPFISTKRRTQFCSRLCSNKSRTGINPERNGSKIKEPKNCKICDKYFLGYPLTRLCSIQCIAKEKDIPRHAEYLLGKSSSQTCRRFLIEQYGAKCMDCGWDKINPTTNKCPIELEHIDGNSSNNLPENLKLICPNCHSLTTTYKALNKGNGRYDRMQRYKSGKSY